MIVGRVTRGSASRDKENVRPVLIQSPSLDQVVERITEETGHEVTKISLKTVKTYMSTCKHDLLYFPTVVLDCKPSFS